MMICNRCKHEINEGENFCPKCGLRVGAVPQPQLEDLTNRLRSGAQYVWEHVPANMDELSTKADSIQQQLKSYLQGTKSLNRPIVYLGIGLMQVLTVLLWFADCIHMAVAGQSESMNMHEVFGGVEYMSYITVGLLLVSAVCVILPVFVPGIRRLKSMLLPRIASVWTTCMFAIGLFSSSEAERQYSSYNAVVGPTLGGFLLGFLCIATVILAFAITKKKKNAPRHTHYLTNNEEEM